MAIQLLEFDYLSSAVAPGIAGAPNGRNTGLQRSHNPVGLQCFFLTAPLLLYTVYKIFTETATC
jgi:hypothetical protein